MSVGSRPSARPLVCSCDAPAPASPRSSRSPGRQRGAEHGWGKKSHDERRLTDERSESLTVRCEAPGVPSSHLSQGGSSRRLRLALLRNRACLWGGRGATHAALALRGDPGFQHALIFSKTALLLRRRGPGAIALGNLARAKLEAGAETLPRKDPPSADLVEAPPLHGRSAAATLVRRERAPLACPCTCRGGLFVLPHISSSVKPRPAARAQPQ